MNNMHKLKSQYAETRTIEYLTVPLSHKGWQLLNALSKREAMPLPELMERALEIAFTADEENWQ